MPIDPNFLPALEQELVFAKQVAAGGQTTDPGRIAAIEEQIKLHKAAAKKAEVAPENASNESTDYQSHDKTDEKVKSARAKAKPETTVEDTETRETTDA